MTRPPLRTRLAYDFTIVREMPSPHMSVEAYASTDDACAGRLLPEERALAGYAEAYLVTYRVPMHSLDRKPLASVLVLFNLTAGLSYPDSTPTAQVVSATLPFAPHVHPRSGMVCLGELWSEGRGELLFGDLAVHVMRLLNFEENDPGANFDGFNADAICFWRDELHSKPLNPGLIYPSLPTQLAYGITAPRVLKRHTPAPVRSVLRRSS